MRSALRAARALERSSDVESCARFGEFVRNVLRSGKMAEKYLAICAEEGDADK